MRVVRSESREMIKSKDKKVQSSPFYIAHVHDTQSSVRAVRLSNCTHLFIYYINKWCDVCHMCKSGRLVKSKR